MGRYLHSQLGPSPWTFLLLFKTGLPIQRAGISPVNSMISAEETRCHSVLLSPHYNKSEQKRKKSKEKKVELK